MASSDSQIDKPQPGRPKRAELPDVNINAGAQSINTDRASLRKLAYQGMEFILVVLLLAFLALVGKSNSEFLSCVFVLFCILRNLFFAHARSHSAKARSHSTR